MAIKFCSEDIAFPALDVKQTSIWLQRVAAVYEKKIGVINYLFCSDEYILKVNNQYLQHDYYTDIITFDYSERNTVAGDIFISLETVKSNAETYGVDFQEELHRVIVHGLLHLCGQNDKLPAERAEMTRKENAALELTNEK